MRRRMIVWIAALLLLFSGCSGESAGPGSLPEGGSSESFTPYQAPPLKENIFHEEQAIGNEQVQLDISSTEQGYIALAATSEKKLKCQVLFEEYTYTYNLSSDGTPSFFPLQGGSGNYQLKVMENIEDNKYACVFSNEFSVQLSDEFQPFLRPSDYVMYTSDSQCVQKARELAENASDELGVVNQVYDFICSGVVYDREKAATVQSGYLPDPDETMESGKGICFDYASLAAAMLRSQGIPTKLIFGYVSPDDLYHAWNMFYTEKTGWVTVSYEVREGTWNRLDLTFSANGEDGTFIGNGENYSDVYCY